VDSGPSVERFYLASQPRNFTHTQALAEGGFGRFKEFLEAL
jgi:hypothetical protein